MYPSTFLFYIPKPTNRFDKLQNFLGSLFEIIGRVLGLLCVRKNVRTSKYDKGPIFLTLWSNFILLYQCISTSIVLFKYTFEPDQFFIERIDLILRNIVGFAYFLMIGSLCLTTMIKRSKIVEMLNEAIEIQCYRQTQDNSHIQMKRKLLIKLIVKVTLDAIMIGGTSVYKLASPCDPIGCSGNFNSLFNLTFGIIMTNYCFFTTAYFVIFEFESYLLHKNCNDWDGGQFLHVASVHYKLICFGRKVNKLFQSTLAFFILEGLIAFVNMVIIFIVHMN